MWQQISIEVFEDGLSPNHLEPERPKLLIIMDSHHNKLKKPKLIDLTDEEYFKVEIARCLIKNEINININKILDNYWEKYNAR